MNNKLPLACILITPLIAAGCATTATERPGSLNKATSIPSANDSTLAVSAKSHQLASGGSSGKVRLRALPQGDINREWQAHDQPVTGVAFGRDDRYLVSTGYDGDIAVWTPQGKAIKRWRTDSPITAFVMSPDKNEIVTGHKSGWIRYWRVRDHALLGEKRALASEIKSLSMSPDGGEIAFGDNDARMALWNPRLDKVRRFDNAPNSARSLAFAPDGRFLYGADWSNLYRWDLTSGKVRTVATDHNGVINSILFTPSAELASSNPKSNKAVLILNADSSPTLSALQKNKFCGGKVSVSADGCYMATKGDDAGLRIWSLNSPCVIPKQELYGSR